MTEPVDDPHLAELTALRAEVAQLSVRLSNAEHATQHLGESLDGIETQLLLALENTAVSTEETPPQPAALTAPIEPDRMDIDVLTEWVDANIGRWAQRKLARHPGQAGFVWCTQWRDHPEAISLLWTLRRAWLDRVNQPGPAMLEYFLHYFYPALSALVDPLGPFHACAANQHTDSPTLLPRNPRHPGASVPDAERPQPPSPVVGR
jgi:hypothetical protein